MSVTGTVAGRCGGTFGAHGAGGCRHAAATTVGALTLRSARRTAVDVGGHLRQRRRISSDAINSQVAGVYASIDSTNHLVLSSGEALTVTGAGATATRQRRPRPLARLAEHAERAQRGRCELDDPEHRRGADLGQHPAQHLGAIQNRFQSTINSLQGVSENLSASRSRILDTDFASETAALTRAQILQQAGTAMVAQANQVPQNVLSLLR